MASLGDGAAVIVGINCSFHSLQPNSPELRCVVSLTDKSRYGNTGYYGNKPRMGYKTVGPKLPEPLCRGRTFVLFTKIVF